MVPMVYSIAPAIDVRWLPCMSHKTIYKGERDYGRYPVITGDDVGQPADVQNDVLSDFDDSSVQDVI